MGVNLYQEQATTDGERAAVAVETPTSGTADSVMRGLQLAKVQGESGKGRCVGCAKQQHENDAYAELGLTSAKQQEEAVLSVDLHN